MRWSSSDPDRPGHRGGERQPRRPPAVDGDQLAIALRRRDAGEPVMAIVRHLTVGRSTLCRTLAAYDEAMAANEAPRTPPGS